MTTRAGGCAAHRGALLDFIDHREIGPGTPAALDHLDHCHRCEAELAEIALAIHAVRRLMAEARTRDAPPDAWDRLRARIQRPAANAWRARSALAGLVVSASLVAFLIGPTTVWRAREVVEREPGPNPSILRALTIAELQTESEFMIRVRAERAVPAAPPRIASGTVYWTGPDGLGGFEPITRMDVQPDRAT